MIRNRRHKYEDPATAAYLNSKEKEYDDMRRNHEHPADLALYILGIIMLVALVASMVIEVTG